MRQIKINSVTGSEIITTSEVKDYVRIDTTADDTIISRMIVQARIWCENYISKDIKAKTRSYYIPETNSGIFDQINYTTLGLSDDLLKQAMLQLVSTYYDNRADFVSDTKGSIDEVPSSTKNILNSYKTMFL